MNQEPLPPSPTLYVHKRSLDAALDVISSISAEREELRNAIRAIRDLHLKSNRFHSKRQVIDAAINLLPVLACQDARETAQERDDYRRQRDGLQVALTKALETIAKMTYKPN